MATDKNWQHPSGAAQQYQRDLVKLLTTAKNIDELSASTLDKTFDATGSIHDVLQHYEEVYRSLNREPLADALAEVQNKITTSPSFGGLGIDKNTIPTPAQYDEIILLTEAWLESVQSQQHSRNYLLTSSHPAPGTRPMTLAQKIFTQHTLSSGFPRGLAVNDVIRAGIDWILASELSWAHMAHIHAALGAPGIFRNDRFWLAGDHVVHPTIREQPKIQTYVRAAERARQDFKMTEYQGMNYTIMHTEFVRARAEPGMLVLGSDSHTCSAGAVGCLGIGLGAADVMMALTLGETWFKVPESVFIDLEGEPGFGMSGKDVILHILRELKRNTMAADRIVEFGGAGARHLSVDARFAICNMCTEFGAITGLFVPDAVTREYVQKRKRKANRSSSLYFQPDPDAVYADKYVLDLSLVEPTIAVYPEPDNVVPVSEKAGVHLDGVFIGACTTTEEELVLAGLILKAGLEQNLPMAKGKRHYVAGSLPIVEKLRELGILDIYEAAGFTRGPPGCSMCVGLSAEKAAEGETWLSSQNRNFRNRMGPGAFGHITSAIVCAASAFSMKITSPKSLLEIIDKDFFRRYQSIPEDLNTSVQYVEPKPIADDRTGSAVADDSTSTDAAPEEQGESQICSRIVALGDFIDTDALAPGFAITSCTTDEEFGQHVLSLTHPDFRQQVADGQRVVVAGHAFGVGSSRECAVSALKGAGVKAVIAKSFAFIYGRNQPSLGLLGIVMDDEEFYACAKDGEEISIDLPERSITVGGRRFEFVLSEMERRLTLNKGITKSFKKYGNAIWEKLNEVESPSHSEVHVSSHKPGDPRLQW